MQKDFERKKAAFEYSRSRTAKSGKLDPLKLHAYKTSEDIFLTTTQFSSSKNHMESCCSLSLSGSMAELIEDVTAQAITIAMFCRQVNIPFEAYSFTTTSYWRRSKQEEGMREALPEASEINAEGCKVVEMFSSKMNKKTFDEASYIAFAVAKAHAYSNKQAYHISGHYLHKVLIKWVQLLLFRLQFLQPS